MLLMWVDLTLSTVRKPKREGFDYTEMQHSGMKNGGNVLKKQNTEDLFEKNAPKLVHIRKHVCVLSCCIYEDSLPSM